MWEHLVEESGDDGAQQYFGTHTHTHTDVHTNYISYAIYAMDWMQ